MIAKIKMKKDKKFLATKEEIAKFKEEFEKKNLDNSTKHTKCGGCIKKCS